MRLAMIAAAAVLAASPAMAQTLVIQGPNPGAANNAENAAHAEHHDAQVDASKARQDERAAHYDAATGNYGAAAQAQNSARDLSRDSHIDNSVAHRDANAARSDDSYRLQVR